jgi:hypothetical protein
MYSKYRTILSTRGQKKLSPQFRLLLTFNFECHMFSTTLCLHDTYFILNYVLRHIWNTLKWEVAVPHSRGWVCYKEPYDHFMYVGWSSYSKLYATFKVSITMPLQWVWALKSLIVYTILRIRSWMWSHFKVFHEIFVLILNSRLEIAYCICNHQNIIDTK